MTGITPAPAPIAAPQIKAALDLALLQLGQALDARVVGEQPSGLTRLTTHVGVIDLELPAPLPVGSTVRLQLQKTPDGQPQIALQVIHLEGKAPLQAGGALKTPAPMVAISGQTGVGTAGSIAASASMLPALLSAAGATQQQGVREVLSQTLRRAASDQHSMAPLLANLTALSEADATPLPASVRAAVHALLGLALPVEQSDNAESLQASLQKSGLFQEANLANAKAGQALALDLKSALFNLKATLETLLGEQSAPTFLGGVRPPPPRKGGAPIALAQESATIRNLSEPEAVARTLLAQTDGALDRLRLMQIASLPQSPEPMMQMELPVQHLVAELPIAYNAQQTGLLHIQIDHEAEQEAGAAQHEEKTWKVRFAVDIDTVGAVHALIMLKGGFTTVQIWAERPQTAELFNAHLGDLRHSLAESHLEVEDIQCRVGLPLMPPAPLAARSGTFLDTQT